MQWYKNMSKLLSSQILERFFWDSFDIFFALRLSLYTAIIIFSLVDDLIVTQIFLAYYFYAGSSWVQSHEKVFPASYCQPNFVFQANKFDYNDWLLVISFITP